MGHSPSWVRIPPPAPRARAALAISTPLIIVSSFWSATLRLLVLSPQSGFTISFQGSPSTLAAYSMRSRTSSGGSILSVWTSTTPSPSVRGSPCSRISLRKS